MSVIEIIVLSLYLMADISIVAWMILDDWHAMKHGINLYEI